jgi:hypothetical protein
MELSITRQQRRTMLGGTEYATYLKLAVSKEEQERIQRYARMKMVIFIGKFENVYAGTNLDTLRKGVEIKQKNVDIALAIEYQTLKDLAALRSYVERAAAFGGNYTFAVPADLDELDAPEGYLPDMMHAAATDDAE